MGRAIAYLRMSEGKDDGDAWKERQRADSRAIADRKGATLDDADVIVDTASASRFSRKARTGYAELLRRIETGNYDFVICWMEDRAHRQVLELAEFIDLCRKHGVTPITPAAEYDLDDPDQVSLWFIKVRFAEAEVEKTSKRLRRQRLQAAEKGRAHHGGMRPFGFMGAGKQAVSRQRALAEQEMLRDAADGIIAGDTLRSICSDWNRDGMRTAGNAQWTPTILRRTLLSPRNAGYREHNGTLYEASEWLPIIPRAQWLTLQAILTDPTRTTAKGGGQPKHLLSGLVFCGVCGNKLYCRTPATKNGVRAYYCADATGTGGHVHRSAPKLEAHILDTFFAELRRREQAWQQAADKATADDPTRPILERLALNRARLDGLKAKEDEALELELDGDTDGATRLTNSIERLRSRYLDEIERDRESLARLQGERVVTHIPPNLEEIWPELSLDRRRSILAAVFRGTRIEVHPQKHGRGPHFDPAAVKVVPAA